MKSSTFWDIKPCNLLKVTAACFTLGGGICLAYYSTLKMEATRSSETSADFQWTIRRYIP
jgi:hypothetical protein